MNSPLVLIHYQNLMPGSRLVHRLEELGFRVKSASPSSSLADQVRELSPMAMVCDLEPDVDQHLEAIRTIRGIYRRNTSPYSLMPILVMVLKSLRAWRGRR